MKRILKNESIKALIVGLLILSLLLIPLLGTGVNAQTVTPAPTSTSTPGQISAPAILSMSLTTSLSTTPPASPQPNKTYYNVKVSVQVAGFNIVSKIGQANVPGEGHLIYYWVQPPTFPDEPAYSEQGSYFTSTSTTATWTNNTPSYWIFSVQLVNNDDTPLNPPVYAEIVSNMAVPGKPLNSPMITSVSLAASAPSNPLASPQPNTTYMDVQVNVGTAGIDLVDKNGDPNVDGEGHLYYYWKVEPVIYSSFAGFGTGYSFISSTGKDRWTNDTPGYRSYSVQLVNNDNSPFDPPVYAVFKTNMQIGMAATPVSPVSPAISTIPPVSTPPLSTRPPVTSPPASTSPSSGVAPGR